MCMCVCVCVCVCVCIMNLSKWLLEKYSKVMHLFIFLHDLMIYQGNRNNDVAYFTNIIAKNVMLHSQPYRHSHKGSAMRQRLTT